MLRVKYHDIFGILSKKLNPYRVYLIFSLAVFKENDELLSHCLHCHAKTYYCNISLITEDVYFKLGQVVNYEKVNLYNKNR